MGNLTVFSKMTSMQIAEITGKRHDHILRDISDEIEKLRNAGIDTAPKFGLCEREGLTGKIPYYELSKEGVLQLAARYDAAVRAKLIELAMKQETTQFQVPQNMGQALRLAADLWEENQKMLPKAEYFDAIVERNLLTNFRDTAKELHIKEQEFIGWLLGKGYIYRDARQKLKPYAEYVPGLFELKESINGNWKGTQTLITPKGRETFRLLFKQAI